MTAQQPGQRPEHTPARDEEMPAQGADTPPMSELLASCAAAAAVSRPPAAPETPERPRTRRRRASGTPARH
ncbi:hypothetical protein [Streptomyces albus]|uniref:hypothetical protein n=1 Tax=Streptomyces TaxID=1883 RepID=UPI0004BDC7B4|nr:MULTISPECIES: hypothetical protein [Streptomyces]KPC91994.1 hypothetical protein ADL27_27830 [Streptomyces sp. NRRL F-6602]MDI6412302.1 hypothetical protein [Streptomyces albus]